MKSLFNTAKFRSFREIFFIFCFIFFAVLVFFCMQVTNGAFAGEPLFPVEITNDKPEPNKAYDSVTVTGQVVYTVNGREVRGVMVKPKGDASLKHPAVLLVQMIDELPKDQMLRMKMLASNGFLVMCVPWKNFSDVQHAYKQMLLLKQVNPRKTAVLGVHDGATCAITLTCTEPGIRGAVSIAGRPDYESKSGNPALTLRVPILLIHGAADTQVPVSVSQYFYYYLQDKEKKAEIILLPNTRHYYNDTEWYQIMRDSGKFFNNCFSDKKV